MSDRKLRKDLRNHVIDGNSMNEVGYRAITMKQG